MKKTLIEEQQRFHQIIERSESPDNSEIINRLKSNEVSYMELEESEFKCGYCIFFQKNGFCNNKMVKTIVNGDKGCCNLYSPKNKDLVDSSNWKTNK